MNGEILVQNQDTLQALSPKSPLEQSLQSPASRQQNFSEQQPNIDLPPDAHKTA